MNFDLCYKCYLSGQKNHDHLFKMIGPEYDSGVEVTLAQEGDKHSGDDDDDDDDDDEESLDSDDTE